MQCEIRIAFDAMRLSSHLLVTLRPLQQLLASWGPWRHGGAPRASTCWAVKKSAS